jgi:hypothetical protein
MTSLERALEASRDVGVVVGMFMAIEWLGRAPAFDQLRVVGQHQKREPSVVAAAT